MTNPNTTNSMTSMRSLYNIFMPVTNGVLGFFDNLTDEYNLYPGWHKSPSRENLQVSRQFKQKFRRDRWVLGYMYPAYLPLLRYATL